MLVGSGRRGFSYSRIENTGAAEELDIFYPFYNYGVRNLLIQRFCSSFDTVDLITKWETKG